MARSNMTMLQLSTCECQLLRPDVRTLPQPPVGASIDREFFRHLKARVRNHRQDPPQPVDPAARLDGHRLKPDRERTLPAPEAQKLGPVGAAFVVEDRERLRI